jgi:hypothetical protein
MGYTMQCTEREGAGWFFFSDASSQGELVKPQEVGCLDRRRKALLLSLKGARLLRL